MLEALTLENVGPAPRFAIEFKKRLNILTGDNGLGKSFLLDVAWWAITHTWARGKVLPQRGRGLKSTIQYRYTVGNKGPFQVASTFDRQLEEWQEWLVPDDRGKVPGLMLYAQVDGGFSVWDSLRNSWLNLDGSGRPSAFLFRPSDVWNGLREGDRSLCEGLIRDWVSWQRENGERFHELTRVLERLSPSSMEPLAPGDLTRLSVIEPLDHPTLRMPYGQDVALVHASAGMRRIVSLAYLLVWSWHEHLRAAELQDVEPTKEVFFVIDEIEAHLHPQWQRRIVPALLDVVRALTGSHDLQVQILTATHSPLVMASLEPFFDETVDIVWELDLVKSTVSLHPFTWARQGDASAWLTSSIFDLREPGSVEAEEAITSALELLRRKKKPSKKEVLLLDGKLRQALGDVDPFWIRWSAFAEQYRGER